MNAMHEYRRSPMRRTMVLLLAAVAAFVSGGCAQLADPSRAADADPQQLVAAIGKHSVVLLGEVHDNAAQHAMREQALRRWLEGGARPSLLMEQFDRERQGDLDRALAQPGVSADAVIAAAGAPSSRPGQGWRWPLYRPYVALAIEYRLPIVAANVSRADTRRVVSEGLQALGFDPNVPPDIAEAQASDIVDSHCGQLDAADAQRLVAAQVARDQFMARMIERAAPNAAVLLAGNGHVRSDIGVPRWLTPATRQRSVAIGLLESGTSEDGARFDVVLRTAEQPRADPCEAMRAAPAPAAVGGR
jgi:uncharacterized iron-regulated protein